MFNWPVVEGTFHLILQQSAIINNQSKTFYTLNTTVVCNEP